MALPLVSCACGSGCVEGGCESGWDVSAVVAAAVAPLASVVRAGGLSVRGRVDALAGLERARAVLDGLQLRVIAAMAAQDPDGRAWAREDVAAALRISPRSAGNRMALAESLSGRFPRMLALLEAGRVTVLHARKLDELTAHVVDDEVAGLVESRVLERAQSQTVGEFGQTVRRAVLRVDAASAAARLELARKERRVAITPVEDGMAQLYWRLPAEQAVQVAASVDAVTADPHPGDPRTADQRRSDALFILITSPGTPDAAAGGSARPTVLVTVPVTVLSGDSDAPGELAGYGPIPANLARRIAADPTSTWKRLVIDEYGRLLDYGRSTYRPPADLTRHVIARDQTCCFPGCTRTAARCELDHCRDWAEGGHTSADNLHALCPRHHHLKHETGWRYHDLPNGDIEWASPTGHRYTRHPRTYDTGSDTHPPPQPQTTQRPPLPDDPPF